MCIGLAACGGGSGGGDDDPTGDGGPTGDAPPPATPLTERLTVSMHTAPAGVMVGDTNYRIWGSQSLKIAPVFTAPRADCTTLVGYTTGTSSPTARVTVIGANDQLVTTYDLGAFELRGLAAEPDGHFGALLWDGQQTLYVRRYDATGTMGWNASLDDPLAVPDDFNIGESRLAFGGGRYAAYYHVHGISGFANGHEGDQYKYVDTSGAVTTRWQWGCSHSMSELVGHDGTNFLSACVTDCFPGTSGDFATNSIGGIYLDNSRKVIDVDAACNGSVAGELGSMTPAPGGWRLVFNAHQNPATRGQNSYSTSTMNQDIGFVSIAGTPGTVKWLTTTSANEANSSIARWQPSGGSDEQYVVGWSQGSTYTLALVSAAGDVVATYDVTGTAKWGERDDPFRTDPRGDIVWAWFDAAGATSFKLARIASGGSCP